MLTFCRTKKRTFRVTPAAGLVERVVGDTPLPAFTAGLAAIDALLIAGAAADEGGTEAELLLALKVCPTAGLWLDP